MSEVYLNFNLEINPLSTQVLFKIIQEQLAKGMKKLYLLISSPGGNVDPGIAIYNFLKGLPIEVITHNYGSCDSIAALIFCAGEKRYTVANSRFLIHGIGLTVQNQRFNEISLRETLDSLKNQRETISKIIAKECGKKVEEVEKDMLNGIVLNPDEAIKYGLATEIKDDLIPLGVNFINVTL
ncbi:MAG: ATP-dependent Clp protease proteolytic subunit [Candidatus Marinimicrobia bacterium]|nr:ATP-dependent Clp protease proteolytic subunit [Candidatus Neomarinimicrobiota bacterium]